MLIASFFLAISSQNRFTACPSFSTSFQASPNGPSWCWWLLAVLPLEGRAQLPFVALTSLKDRLSGIRKVLLFMAQSRHRWCGSHGKPPFLLLPPLSSRATVDLLFLPSDAQRTDAAAAQLLRRGFHLHADGKLRSELVDIFHSSRCRRGRRRQSGPADVADRRRIP